MAYGLPARGQADWDDELNNSLEVLKATVDSADAKATVAVSTATAAAASAQAAALSAAASTAGGPVSSVNGLLGAVTLTADDLNDGTAKKLMTSIERTKLSTIAASATANAADSALRDRSTHTGTQTSATISDLTEAVQDAVAALLVSGANVTLTYNDAAGSLQVTAAGGDAEAMRDTIGAALVGVGAVAVTVNDPADTITISTTATVNSTDAQLRDRTTHTGLTPLSGVAAGTMLQAPLDGSVSTSAGLARPSARTDIFFTWNSTVQPSNMLAGDKWEQPA